jgi:membrane protein
MHSRALWPILGRTFTAWKDHEAPRIGAALAFYTILSLAPLVILAIAVVGFIFGHSAVETELLGQVDSTIGHQGSETVRALIEQAQEPASGTFASIIAVITLLFGASGVFGELRSALNTMWDVKPRGDIGILGTIKQQFFSFGMVLSVGFLLLTSLLISASLAVLGKFFGGMLPLPESVLSMIDFAISTGGTIVLFALIFRYVPETRIAWRDVWLGAIATALMFTIGKFVIGLYLGKAVVGSAYGAAGSLVVVLVWVYYSGMIFLLGAEFTHVLSIRHLNGLASEARNVPAIRDSR